MHAVEAGNAPWRPVPGPSGTWREDQTMLVMTLTGMALVMWVICLAMAPAWIGPSAPRRTNLRPARSRPVPPRPAFTVVV